MLFSATDTSGSWVCPVGGISRKVAGILGQKLGLLDLRQDCWHYMAVQFLQLDDADDLQAPELKMVW